MHGKRQRAAKLWPAGCKATWCMAEGRMAMGSGVKDENHFVGLHECAHKPLMRPQLMNTRRLPGAGVGVMVPSKAIEGTAQAARARGSRRGKAT